MLLHVKRLYETTLPDYNPSTPEAMNQSLQARSYMALANLRSSEDRYHRLLSDSSPAHPEAIRHQSAPSPLPIGCLGEGFIRINYIVSDPSPRLGGRCDYAWRRSDGSGCSHGVSQRNSG